MQIKSFEVQLKVKCTRFLNFENTLNFFAMGLLHSINKNNLMGHNKIGENDLFLQRTILYICIDPFEPPNILPFFFFFYKKENIILFFTRKKGVCFEAMKRRRKRNIV